MYLEMLKPCFISLFSKLKWVSAIYLLPKKTMPCVILKNFQYNISESTLKIQRLCQITESYFYNFFISNLGSLPDCTTKIARFRCTVLHSPVLNILKTISEKSCETRTTFPLIHCWFQVSLIISCQFCVAWFFRLDKTFRQREGEFWSLSGI